MARLPILTPKGKKRQEQVEFAHMRLDFQSFLTLFTLQRYYNPKFVPDQQFPIMILDSITRLYRRGLDVLRPMDGLGPLALRIYLAPIMIEAGWKKIAGFEGTVNWFDRMGMPFPELMAFLAAAAEFGGGILLIFGFCTRLAAIPLMVAMLVAAFLVHAENGWLAISDSSSMFANERVMEAAGKKEIIKDLVREHGNYRYLTSSGPITILNNGMEFAITYFVMLLALLFTGGGRFFSVDYWIARWRNIV